MSAPQIYPGASQPGSYRPNAAKTPAKPTLPPQIITPGPARSTQYSSHGDQQLISEARLKSLYENRLEDQGAIEIIKMIADEFVDSVTSFSCKLARHRGSDSLDSIDVQRHLYRNWDIIVPVGHSHADLQPGRGKKRPLENHLKRLHAIKKAKK